jgi:hypothetical protein
LWQSDSDTKRPTVHIDVSSLRARLDPEIEIESQKTLVQRCRNYSEDDCRAAYNRASRYNVPANMTQETVDYSRTGRVSERIAFDANPVEEEIFQGDGGGDFSDAEEQDIGESVSGERDDEVQSVGMNDDIDFSIHNEEADQEAIDFGANDEASLSDAMATMTLMPYEEYTPLFKQFVDFVQANRSNSRVLWGKSLILDMMALMENDVAGGGHLSNLSSGRAGMFDPSSGQVGGSNLSGPAAAAVSSEPATAPNPLSGQAVASEVDISTLRQDKRTYQTLLSRPKWTYQTLCRDERQRLTGPNERQRQMRCQDKLRRRDQWPHPTHCQYKWQRRWQQSVAAYQFLWQNRL